MDKQIYALKLKDGWAIFLAPMPCEAGVGQIVRRGVRTSRITKALRTAVRKFLKPVLTDETA